MTESENTLLEKYIFTDNTLGYDLDLFYQKKSPLFICGLSGSGKTTLGKKMSESLKIPLLELDSLDDKIYNNLKDKLPKLDSEELCRNFRAEIEKAQAKEIMSKQIRIVEGVQIAFCFNTVEEIRPKILSSSIIIMGTSLLLSIYRSVERGYSGLSNLPKDLIDRIRFNSLTLQKHVETLRRERSLSAKTISIINLD